MCQAYEGERSFILACEDFATLKGFAAARFGSPMSVNPYDLFCFKYEKEAWDHGWRCWQEQLLPWALEKKYRGKVSVQESLDAQDYFRRTRVLLPGLEKIINQYEPA